MIFDIFVAMVAFLFARAIWNFIVYRAKECGQIPLVWMIETLALLLAFF
jgi:hypothetical protein